MATQCPAAQETAIDPTPNPATTACKHEGETVAVKLDIAPAEPPEYVAGVDTAHPAAPDPRG